MARKSVLIISRNLPPTRGGIERLLQQAVHALAAEMDCHVIGPRGCRVHMPREVHVVEVPFGLAWFFPAAALAVVLSRVRRRHDVCIGGSGLAAPLVWLAALLHRCPRVLFVHGLDLVAPYRLYRWVFLPAIRRADRLIANSAMTARLAVGTGVVSPRVTVLHPGVSVSAAGTLRQAEGGRPVRLLAVGRLVSRKGLPEFIERTLPRVRAALPEAVLQVVGEEPPADALRAGGTRGRILAAAQRCGLTGAVQLLGSVDDAELARLYRDASLLVFPCLQLHGDTEGFGMVIVEAAAHGLPAVAFDVGGVSDAMSNDNGVLVPAHDYEQFADAVVRIARGETALTPQTCRRHALRYDWDVFGATLRRIIVEAIATQCASGPRHAD